MSSPHHFADRILRKALRDPQNLRDLVEAAAGELARGLDFERATFVERELQLPDLARREADILCEVPWRDDVLGMSTLIAVLLEHQSQPDSPMPLRMLLYAALYWDRTWHERARQRARSADPQTVHASGIEVPLVVPIVFHTGPRPWSAPRSLADMFRAPAGQEILVPRWPILLWDLAERSTDALLESGSRWLESLAVVRAEHEDATTFRQVFAAAVQQLESAGRRRRSPRTGGKRPAVASEGRHVDLLELILSWAMCRRPKPERRSLLALAARHAPRQHRERIRTMGNKLEQTLEEWAAEQARERYEQGLTEGRTEGLTEGELRACRDLLRKYLERRFGAISTELAARIEAESDVARLRAFFERILDGASPDEFEL